MGARRAALLAALVATAAALFAGCGRSGLPSRAHPSYTSPDGLIRFWAPKGWAYRTWPRHGWKVAYRTGDDARALQRHAIGWMDVEYDPGRSDLEGATLFHLFVFTTAGYESLAAEPGMPAGVPIAGGGGRVVLASIPTLNPYESGDYSGGAYLRMRPSLDTLRSAIRLAGGEGATSAPWGADTVAYSIRLPAADAPGREIHARFAPDGHATWTTTYLGKGYPIVERASWEMRNGEVTLTFGDVGSGGPAGPLTYAVADSALVPTAWPREAWGFLGAPMLFWRPR